MDLSKLEKVQQDVNARLIYASDPEHYNRPEHWAIPEDGLGDCEDYALEKRRLLKDAGWPMTHLRMATCWTETGRYHAVLIAVDKPGTWWVLDNRQRFVRVWSAMSHYKWHLMQDGTGGWKEVKA